MSTTNQNAYETTGGFTTYGIEYKTGPDGYVTWFSDGKPTWTMNPSAIGKTLFHVRCQSLDQELFLLCRGRQRGQHQPAYHLPRTHVRHHEPRYKSRIWKGVWSIIALRGCAAPQESGSTLMFHVYQDFSEPVFPDGDDD